MDCGFPAPIAAARAINSEASVAPTGEMPPQSAAASTVSTTPFCVQETCLTMGHSAHPSIIFLNAELSTSGVVARTEALLLHSAPLKRSRTIERLLTRLSPARQSR